MQERSRKYLLELFAEAPSELFHYTSAAGLHGMLESKTILGGNYAFMNDKTEFTYGTRLLGEIAEERGGSAASSFDAEVLRSIVESERRITSADLYLTCFCAKGDLLSQWRGYGNSDSRYCMQVQPAKFEFALKRVAGIFPVVYDVTKQRDLLSGVLETHLGVIDSDDLGDVEDCIRCVYSCCLMAFAFIKNPVFEEEHEWRATMFAYPGEHVSSLKFLPSSGMMRPYLPILRGAGGGGLPITKIIAGASRFVPQAIRSAELMLQTFGYAGVSVDASRVPLSG